MENTNTTDMGKKKKTNKFKSKAKIVGDITVESVKVQMEHPMTYVSAIGVAFAQSLVTQGDVKSGAKAGLGVYGTVIGLNIVYNIINNLKAIKNA